MTSYLDATLIFKTVIALLMVWTLKYYFSTTKLPPGPWGLPIVGYVPWIGKFPYQKFIQLGNKYGGIFSLNLAGEMAVVLNDWPSIQAALVDQAKCFSGRARIFIVDQITQGKDMTFSDGAIWLQQRNLMVKCMRNIGLGKRSMEASIEYEIHELIDMFNKSHGKNVSMTTVFMKPTLKILWNMISSHSLTDDELKKLESISNEIVKRIRPNSPFNCFPRLRYTPPNGFGYKETMKANKQLLNYLKSIIKDHQLNRTRSMEPDFIDLYLDSIEETGFSDGFYAPYTVDNLLGSLWNLILGGHETSNATCQWAFLYMAHFPNIQQKIQKEIDLIVGMDRMPTLDDVPKLPYLQATMLEVYRCSSAFPISIPHRAMEDAEVFGYKIPKNTMILQNIYAVHFDPNLWENPKEFHPERFLDEFNSINRPPYLIPFSTGPRICIGESVFEMEFKLIFSSLLQKFTFSLPNGLPVPTLEGDFGLLYKPHPFSLFITKRYS